MENNTIVSLAERVGDPSAVSWLLGATVTAIGEDGGTACYRLFGEGREITLSEEEWIALEGFRILMTHKNAFLELAK